MYGGDTPYLDYEVITLAYNFIKNMGIDDVTLNINSIGCPECRKKYNAALREYLKANEDKLCDTCKKRMVNNPLRVLDCKSPECKEVVKAAPRIIDYRKRAGLLYKNRFRVCHQRARFAGYGVRRRQIQ